MLIPLDINLASLMTFYTGSGGHVMSPRYYPNYSICKFIFPTAKHQISQCFLHLFCCAFCVHWLRLFWDVLGSTRRASQC